jgi:4,5-dihydroxyphthalate decarboxylase
MRASAEREMATTRVSLIGERYGCVAPLFEGTVRPAGIDLAVTTSPSPQAMRRQLSAWEFDVCEMAFGAYLIAREQGADVTAIPVFPQRAFFHTGFACGAGAHVTEPRGLAGKRIGVPEYVQSATVWARGILEHDFGMDARSMDWYVERSGADSTGEVLGFRPPSGMRVQQTPGGKSLAAMAAAGELDLALLGGNAALAGDGGMRPLFADARAEGRRYFEAHGYVPANHCYMVSGRLARSQPDVVAALYDAFSAALKHARASLPAGALPVTLFRNDRLGQAAADMDAGAFAYGMAANRAMLEEIVALCREQGLVHEAPNIDELFVPVM